MSHTDGHRRADTVSEQSAEQRKPHPGRVAWMQHVNEEKRRRREQGEVKEGEEGGRPLDHGEYGLVARIRKGMDPSGPLNVLFAGRRDEYLGDLGGVANASAKEAKMCDYLAFLDLMFGLLMGQFSGAKRLSRSQLLELNMGVTRNAVSFSQIAKQLGLKRRQVEADKTVIVRRYADPVTPRPDDGQAQQQTEATAVRDGGNYERE